MNFNLTRLNDVNIYIVYPTQDRDRIKSIVTGIINLQPSWKIIDLTDDDYSCSDPIIRLDHRLDKANFMVEFGQATPWNPNYS
jgi:hypothetical protein